MAEIATAALPAVDASRRCLTSATTSSKGSKSAKLGVPFPLLCFWQEGRRFVGPHRLAKVQRATFCAMLFLLVAGSGSAEDQSVEGGIGIDAESFRCITNMTHVRQFYVDNLLGNLDATLTVANSTAGGVYPVGTVIQLVPTEVMVKREKGFNAVTHDWEFFELDISKDRTKIRKRGFAEVVNRFGGNCFGCHVQARPQWDFVCETDHGCAPIPITRAMSGALQRTDPRCDVKTISPEDAETLRQLNELLTAPSSDAKPN